jgi:hypothetical protein
MSYKFKLYNILRFNRNTNTIKQQSIEDKLEYLTKADNDVSVLTVKLDNIARKAYKDDGKVYSARSPYKMLLTAFKEILNMTYLYIVRAINNNNILTADNIHAVRGLAALTGFDAIAKNSATGAVLLTIKAFDNDTSTLYIQNGAQLRCKSTGVMYFVLMQQEFEQLNIRSNSAIVLPVVQGLKKQISFTSDGSKLQTLNIAASNIDLSLLEVYINNELWYAVSKLNDMHFNDKTYVVKHSMLGGINIHFGNGTNGLIPKIADTITIKYVASDGSTGNVNANEAFEFINGVLDKSANYVDTKNLLNVKASTDFIGGYDGDSIDAIALNAGLQTTSNAIITVDNYYAFMRKYSHIKLIDVWSEPSINTVNILVAPNIRNYCDRRLSTYFDLSYSDFEFDTEERNTLHANIVSDKKYALMSALHMYQYKLEPYAILIFANINEFSMTQQLLNKTIAIAHESLLNEYDNNAQLIRASKLQNDLQDNITELNQLSVKFVGNTQYINEFGDIDTSNVVINENDTDFLVLPYIAIGDYDSVNFANIPIKILTKSGSDWVELTYTV